MILMLLNSCASIREIKVSAKPIEKPTLELPKADELNMREVDWVLITEKNYQEIFNSIRRTGRPIVLFGLTDKGYSNLGLNLSDIRALIQQQQTIIAAYESYYKNADEALDDANKTLAEPKAEYPLLEKFFGPMKKDEEE